VTYVSLSLATCLSCLLYIDTTSVLSTIHVLGCLSLLTSFVNFKLSSLPLVVAALATFRAAIASLQFEVTTASCLLHCMDAQTNMTKFVELLNY